MSSVSVIIPAYNEEEGITSVIRRVKTLSIDTEIIVVDDGSIDATGKRAQSAGAIVIRHPTNGGYGLAIKTGIRVASHDLIAITDADGTYPVEELPAFFSKMEEGFDMVVGARQGPAYRGTFLKMPARFVFKFLVEFSTGKHIPDINSGLRVFRKSAVQPLFPLLCDVFSFTTTLTLVYFFLHKFVAYIPITYDKRIGKSKVRIIRDSLRTLQYITETIAHFNPIKLFLLLAIVLMLGAVICAIFTHALLGEVDIFSSLLFLVAATIIFGMGIHAEAVRDTGASDAGSRHSS